MLPGDRVFIAQDEMVTLNNVGGEDCGPFERVMGFVGLDSSTVRGLQTMGRDYNHPKPTHFLA